MLHSLVKLLSLVLLVCLSLLFTISYIEESRTINAKPYETFADLSYVYPSFVRSSEGEELHLDGGNECVIGEGSHIVKVGKLSELKGEELWLYRVATKGAFLTEWQCPYDVYYIEEYASVVDLALAIDASAREVFELSLKLSDKIDLKEF